MAGPLCHRAVGFYRLPVVKQRSRTRFLPGGPTRHLTDAKRLREKRMDQGHEATHLYRNHHQRRFDTTMDDLRSSLSKFKKDIKRGFEKMKGKKEKLGGGGHEGAVGSSSSLPQPESRDSAGGGGGQGGDGPDTDNENAGASAVNGPGWGSTASSSAKLVLRGVKDSVDAFPPLKSVAGGLCFILDNYEVWYPSWLSVRLTCPQRTTANKQMIESLAPRVKELAERLCKPVRKGDVEEQERRTRLER